MMTTKSAMSISEAPALTPAEIREELSWLFQRSHRSELVALWGTGSDGVVDVPNAGSFSVVTASCELELRDQLPPVGKRDVRMAFLVPWSHELPLDIAGRFALGGRVLRVGRNRRLPALLGASEADPEAVESRLAEYVLRCDLADPPRLASGRLTLDGLWHAWLRHRWQVPTESGLSAPGLIAWAATSDRGSEFVQAVSASDGAGMRDDLLAWLSDRVSPIAPVVWRAWEQGLGAKLLEQAIVAEAFDGLSSEAVQTWLALGFAGELGGALGDLPAADVAKALGLSVDFALGQLRRFNSSRVSQLIAGANNQIKGEALRRAASKSRRLPCAWDATCEELAATLRDITATPTASSIAQARELLRRMEHHDFFKGDYKKEAAQFARAEMAVRLATWLASPHANPEPASIATYGSAEALAGWYCDHGGYVDWARGRCRTNTADALGQTTAELLAVVDERRRVLDRRFALGLTAWLGAGRPVTSLVPIFDAFERVGAKYLNDHASRRLLVVLMDGMGWAQAVEILQSLQEESVRWGPLSWHGIPAHRVGLAHYPTVVAELPTETAVSRSAFFAGKPMAAGSMPSSAEDPARWAKNKSVKRYFGATETPPLLLRGDSCTADGSLSPLAQGLIEDESKRVVALVINVIDASLHSDAQEVQSWNAASIRPLHAMLDAARNSGRAILLVSDHGHVPSALLKNVGGKPDGSPRWYSAKAAPALADYEVTVDKAAVWVPKGAEALVLACDDQHRYGGNVAAGTHGGASLAEVMIPAVLIGWEGLDAQAKAVGDDDTVARVQGAFTPRWWTFDPEEDLPPIEEILVATPAPKASKKTVSTAQAELPGFAKQAAPVPVLLKGLAESELFQARVPEHDRTEVLRALHYLMQRDNTAPAAAFGAALGIAGYRVAGWVSAKLGERLNLDGYLVVTFNAATNQVMLHRSMLEQLFEVKL